MQMSSRVTVSEFESRFMQKSVLITNSQVVVMVVIMVVVQQLVSRADVRELERDSHNMNASLLRVW